MKGGTWVLMAAGGLAACAAGWGLSRSTTGEKGGAVAVPSGSVAAPAQTTREAKPDPAEPRYEEPAPADNPRVVKWVFSAPAGVEMARNEVTLDAYTKCYHAGVCSIEGIDTVVYGGGKAQFRGSCHWNDYRPEYARTADPIHPINCVSVSDAETFCEWVGGRLPTEAEWFAEASNGGQWEYPWGNAKVSCERAVIQEEMLVPGCGEVSEWPVCSKPMGKSVSGLCDMIGNVSEYVSTDGGYAAVGGDAQSTLDELPAEKLRGKRVGPQHRDNHVGFRCVRDAIH